MGFANKKFEMFNRFLFRFYFLLPGYIKKKVLKIIPRFENGYMYSETIRKIYKREYGINIGYGSYGGCFDRRYIPANVTFGNYCSIARNIQIYRANHPKNKFTSHPLLYHPIAGYVEKDQLVRPPLIIGHDVWIGEWAVILPGVQTIGNGAIIGAGSIVTKNVEPYSIVAGNPAKKIADRFNKDVSDKLESTLWWNLKKEDLIKIVNELNTIINNSPVKE